MEVGKLQVAEGEGPVALRSNLFRMPPNNDNLYCIKFSYLHFPTINFRLVSKLYHHERLAEPTMTKNDEVLVNGKVIQSCVKKQTGSTENKVRIVDAPNVDIPALNIVASFGYIVSVDPSEDDESKIGFWVAKKGKLTAVADDPLRLLGLVSILEARGGDWHRPTEDTDFYSQAVEKAYPD